LQLTGQSRPSLTPRSSIFTPTMPKRSEANRKTNIGVARGVPIFLLAIIGYASWVVTKVICIDYLLNPPASLSRRPQHGSAIAVLVTYYIALVVLLISYGRLLDTVIRRPGLIPRGPQWYAERSRKGKNARSTETQGRSGSRSNDAEFHDPKMPKEIEFLANESLPFRVEDFWLKDIFVCNPDGRPRYCSTCYNWKPDRSHHCSEMNRCILKFDHFCPWVGGVVSETSYKFFIQFNLYGAHILTTTAYFFAQRRQHSHYVNGHWIAMLALSGLFLLFSSGMLMSSGQFAFINSTTIEHLDRKTKVWNLAVYVNQHVLQEIHDKALPLQLISYPRPPEENLQNLAQHTAGSANQAPDGQTVSRSPTLTGHRTFAILETSPGANPFDLGFLGNFTDIMGPTIWDWLLPTRPSPCLNHDDPISLYKLGTVVDELKASTGVTTWDSQASKRRRRRKSRSRRASAGE
jgi:palmitoyltransferase